MVTLEAGPVRMDVDGRMVTVRGKQIQLSFKEFELLEMLLRNAGRVLLGGGGGGISSCRDN